MNITINTDLFNPVKQLEMFGFPNWAILIFLIVGLIASLWFYITYVRPMREI